MSAANDTLQSTPRAARYRAVWRWHFYAGLLVAPVLIVMATTGAIYLFDREIDAWWNRDVHTIAMGDSAQPLAAQERAVRAAHPQSTIARVQLPRSADETSVWTISSPQGRTLNIYVNPYRAEVIGARDADAQPIAIVRKLHGTLLAGEAGSYVVELAACWTLVMLITGVYMWWPRTWRLRGVWVPRVAERGRILWRDLHAVPAAVNALLVGLLILTGLPWSAFWGQQLAQLGQVIPLISPSPNFKAAPTRDGAIEDAHARHRQDASTLPWTVQQIEPPQASGARVIGIAQIEEKLSILSRERFGPGVRIFYPASASGVFTINYAPDKVQGQRTIHVDPATGAVIDDISWTQYSPIAKAVEWGVMTHVGRQYGRANQIAGLLVCLTLLATVIAGIYLWWSRRPKGEFAAPPTRAQDRLPLPLMLGLAACAVIFPLIGASLLLVLGIQWLLGRIMPRRSGILAGRHGDRRSHGP